MSARNGFSHNGTQKVEHLQKIVGLLNAQNEALNKKAELKNRTLQNSLFDLVQGAQAQSELNSISNLAYYNLVEPISRNWVMLTYLYKTHGIIQTAIDQPTLDGLRGGLDIHSDELDADDVKDMNDKLERDSILTTVRESATWARLYGGGGLIVNNGQRADQPLEIKKGDRIELYAVNRWELTPSQRDADFYKFYGETFHESRVLRMSGKPAPYLVRKQLQGWGMSEMERMIEDFNLYLRTKDVVYELLKEAKIDVYRFKGFTTQLATGAGQQLTETRVSLMSKLKQYNGAIVMDIEDEFDQKQLTFAGLADVHKQNMVYIASALRMPMTKLFGLSASGFNSGEDDIENYNAMVESEVREPLRPILRKVIEILTMQMFGEPLDISFNYKPLRVLSSTDQEVVMTSKHNRYLSLYSQGLLTSKELMGLEQSEKMIPIETEVARGAEPEPPNAGLDDGKEQFGKDDKKEAA